MGVKRVVINDEDSQLIEALQDVLGQHGKSFDVVTTHSAAAALQIVRRTPVDLVITGLRASRFDGFQLITALAEHFPGINVIAMVGSRTPILRSAIRLLGADASFRKPVDVGEIAKCVFAQLQIRSRGEVWGIHLTSFIQMLHAERKTCRLILTRPGHIGELFFKEGELIEAEYGAQTGDEAVYEIVSWDEPVIEIDYLPFEREANVSTTLMTLLLEAQKRKDEIAMIIEQKRRHDRCNRLVAVDYDFERMRCRYLIRNISLGGAYVESDTAVSIGQELELTLSALGSEARVSLCGKVVRLGSHGFGVRFNPLTDEQRQFIQDVLA